jgi:hypothetical protein
MDSRQIRNRVADAVAPEAMRVKRDGTIEVKWSYFYRHGRTPETYAEQIKAAIPGAEIVAVADRWAEWPKTSWFVVWFRLPVEAPDADMAAVARQIVDAAPPLRRPGRDGRGGGR